jgi:hypothetical protein
MSYDIEITISGPGGTIYNEIAIVQTVLQKAGYKVTVNDDHPAKDEIMAELCRRARDEDWADVNRHPKVKIIAQHNPWGG